MTRKHFQALADALRASKPGDPVESAFYIQWVTDVLAVASVCKAASPDFKPERFLAACGYER